MALILLLVISLLLSVGAGLTVLAYAILRPPRMSDGKAVYLLQRLSPGDLGIGFEPVVFSVADVATREALLLAGWWMAHPAGGDRTVVLIHGYADAKVGSMAWAPIWRSLGFHILAIDLRAHGESQGRYSTAGAFERQDIDQILNQLRASKPEQSRRLVLFGASLGAAIALAVAEERDDLAGLVLDSPFADFRLALAGQMKLQGLPLPSLLPITLRIAECLSGARFSAIQPVRAIRSSKCPMLLIQSGDDPFISPEHACEMQEAVQSRGDASESWALPGVAHLMAMSASPRDYEERIRGFLNRIGLQGP